MYMFDLFFGAKVIQEILDKLTILLGSTRLPLRAAITGVLLRSHFA
jgi:hypothetical protein